MRVDAPTCTRQVEDHGRLRLLGLGRSPRETSGSAQCISRLFTLERVPSAAARVVDVDHHLVVVVASSSETRHGVPDEHEQQHRDQTRRPEEERLAQQPQRREQEPVRSVRHGEVRDSLRRRRLLAFFSFVPLENFSNFNDDDNNDNNNNESEEPVHVVVEIVELPEPEREPDKVCQTRRDRVLPLVRLLGRPLRRLDRQDERDNREEKVDREVVGTRSRTIVSR